MYRGYYTSVRESSLCALMLIQISNSETRGENKQGQPLLNYLYTSF